MNINKILPTKSDRKEARKLIFSVLKGTCFFVLILVVLAFVVAHPILILYGVGSIAFLIIAFILWTAFAPIGKEDKDAS